LAPIAYLECTKCGSQIPADRPQTVCPKDGGVLYVRYDLAALKSKFTTASLAGRSASMWRFADVLPVTLREGFMPMLPSREYPNVTSKMKAWIHPVRSRLAACLRP
jgi:threonine synthase